MEPIVLKYCTDPNCTKCHGPFSDEALGARRSQDVIDEARQAADFNGHEPTYHAALVVIANEEGAGRWARAIDLVSKIWGKSVHEVMSDAVSL